MNKAFILILMLFLHVLDDFKLQAPVLTNLKQKKYWEANAPEEKYKHDYVVALIMHSISWSFMIMLPIALRFSLHVDTVFVWIFVINAAIHGFIDDLKANQGALSLIQDQCIHICQIIATFVCFNVLYSL